MKMRPDYSDSIIAWHFVGAKLRGGRDIPRDGEWLNHKGPISMCKKGLHASRHPFDALTYAPGAMLCRVECRNDVKEQSDKLVCRDRRILCRVDVTNLLYEFAREQALSVLPAWPNPPEVVVEYLKTGNMSLRVAARRAARGAFRRIEGAAWEAAWAAARDAAWAAAREAAWWAAWCGEAKWGGSAWYVAAREDF